MPVKKESGEENGASENGTGCSPEEELTHPGSFFLRLLPLSCRQESRGGNHGWVSAEYASVLQVCPFRVMVSSDWSVAGQGVCSHCSWF